MYILLTILIILRLNISWKFVNILEIDVSHLTGQFVDILDIGTLNLLVYIANVNNFTTLAYILIVW